MSPSTNKRPSDLELVNELVAAAEAAVRHLVRCEKGKIEHPFKSASLPMLQKAIAKAKRRAV